MTKEEEAIDWAWRGLIKLGFGILAIYAIVQYLE